MNWCHYLASLSLFWSNEKNIFNDKTFYNYVAENGLKMENVSRTTLLDEEDLTHMTLETPEPYEPDLFVEFIVPGVLLNITGLLGLLGNVLSIVILSRPQMKSSVNCILMGLASFDTVLIITSILMFGFPAVYTYTQHSLFRFYFFEIFPYITPIIYPVGMIAQTGSVYLTLAVSMERYVAVCLPLRARSMCTFGRARRLVFGVGMFALLYNLPRFWEVTWRTKFYEEVGDNVTDVVSTPMRDDPTYISVYITWLYIIMMNFLPFVSLAAFNLLIYNQVRRANSERAQLTRLQQKEIGLATMLMVVVVVFFVCNVLALVVNILEVMSINIIALNNISNMLITLNSSVNFIIYCIFGDKFKRIFCKIFCPMISRRAGHHDQFMQRYPNRTTIAGRSTLGPRNRSIDATHGHTLFSPRATNGFSLSRPMTPNEFMTRQKCDQHYSNDLQLTETLIHQPDSNKSLSEDGSKGKKKHCGSSRKSKSDKVCKHGTENSNNITITVSNKAFTCAVA